MKIPLANFTTRLQQLIQEYESLKHQYHTLSLAYSTKVKDYEILYKKQESAKQKLGRLIEKLTQREGQS